MIFSDKSLSQKLELTEARANRDFVRARRAMSPSSGAAWTTAAGAYAMFDGIESPLTQTFGLGIFQAPTAADFDAIERFYAELGAPVFHEVSPLADASAFELLRARGYQPIEFSSVMYRPITEAINRSAAANPRVTARVIEADEEELWARTSADGWATEMDGLREFMYEFGQVSARCAGGVPFLAEIENQPIAAGMLFVYADVALLAGASTVPEARRQGAQAALLDARLRFAAARGCTLATMGASPGSGSQRNGEKNGFRIAYTRAKWHLPKAV